MDNICLFFFLWQILPEDFSKLLELVSAICFVLGFFFCHNWTKLEELEESLHLLNDPLHLSSGYPWAVAEERIWSARNWHSSILIGMSRCQNLGFFPTPRSQK